MCVENDRSEMPTQITDQPFSYFSMHANSCYYPLNSVSLGSWELATAVRAEVIMLTLFISEFPVILHYALISMH